MCNYMFDFQALFRDVVNESVVGQKRKTTQCHDTDLQRVESQLHALPISVLKRPNDMKIRDLKRFLKLRDIDIPSGIERKELEKMVETRRDTTCSICLEELCGHIVKTWPCGHIFHATCNLHYGLGKADSGRTSAVPCPVCKKPLA